MGRATYQCDYDGVVIPPESRLHSESGQAAKGDADGSDDCNNSNAYIDGDCPVLKSVY